jgi:hypothetical protein
VLKISAVQLSRNCSEREMLTNLRHLRHYEFKTDRQDDTNYNKPIHRLKNADLYLLSEPPFNQQNNLLILL